MTGLTDQGSYKPDNLIAGAFPRIARIETITGGAALVKGAVLGRVTINGCYKLSEATAIDGSQRPSAILATDVDASGGDTQAAIYHAGEFNEDALTYGTGHDADTVKASLLETGPATISLTKNQGV